VAQVSLLSNDLRVAALYPRHQCRVPHTPDFLWSVVGSLNFLRLSLKRTAHAVLSRAPYRKFEMWDSTTLASNLHNEAALFLRRPGFLLANGSGPEHPGLKSETWATHSRFVRAIFILFGGPLVFRG
jgi:hypothetical protein